MRQRGMLVDAIKAALHRAITTPRGDALAPIRTTKSLARRLNLTLGEPICSADDSAKRRTARAKLASLRGAKPAATSPRPSAPVLVYFERDRNVRELERIRAMLDAKAIAYSLLDVAGDEATVAFVTRTSGLEADALPIVFVGAHPVGDARALVEADVSGALAKLLGG